jgi:hypothetical protein
VVATRNDSPHDRLVFVAVFGMALAMSAGLLAVLCIHAQPSPAAALVSSHHTRLWADPHPLASDP